MNILTSINFVSHCIYRARAKAAKLQSYYKKLCDEEKLSNMRNQQILSDLARIDSHFQKLETKLQRLSSIKVTPNRPN